MGDLDRRLYTSHPAVAYQRPLVNPYRMFDPQQARQRQGNPGSRAFPVTCSGAGIDLPGFERRVPSPNRYMAFARFCFCKNNKRMIIIISVKRDPISVKRDLISVRRDLISVKRDLISFRRDLICVNAPGRCDTREKVIASREREGETRGPAADDG